MRLFVAGASGAIGRSLVPALIAAGHEVTGMTRRSDHAAEIRGTGAESAVCDVFDPEALHAAVAAARPEVVIHELTALPADLDPRKKGIYKANNRIRTEGTRNLIAAAQAAGAKRFVAQSIAFIYAPVGGPVKAEDDATMTSAVGGEFGASVEATLDLERQTIGAEGMEGVVLRYGFFYGPGTSYAGDGYQASEVRKRRFPVIGDGSGVFSFVHVDDAATATVAACERGSAGIYNVTDDEPAPVREWLPVYAEAVGAKPPRRVPRWLARLVAGSAVTGFATSLRGASNARAKAELGWQPHWASWREGFRGALG
jgi:nucleoside-diphosphate-sugar epimerase